MLDFRALGAHLEAFSAYASQQQQQAERRLRKALEVWKTFGARLSPETIGEAVDEAKPGRIVARPVESLRTRRAAPRRPLEVTVVATDGSQFFPGREVEPTFYLLNIGRIAFHLGTEEPPVLDARPELHYSEEALQAQFEDAADLMATPQLFTALRDEKELEYLLELALEQRRPGRPVVALLDGTLIRWAIQGIQHREVEQQLIESYVALLAHFQSEAIPVGAYISQPESREVINLLQVLMGDEATTVEGLLDRWLFAALLEPGERSPVFRSGSHIQRQYGEHAVHFCYMHMGAEMGRLEFPAWVADTPGFLDTLHAVVWDQAKKGGGYPVALAEAHERAVIRAEEKELFLRLLQQALIRNQGPVAMGTRKQLAKRIVRI